jgi:hypothetical protein
MGLIGPLTKLQGEKRLRPIIIPAMWFQARIQAAFPNVWNSVGESCPVMQWPNQENVRVLKKVIALSAYACYSSAPL